MLIIRLTKRLKGAIKQTKVKGFIGECKRFKKTI